MKFKEKIYLTYDDVLSMCKNLEYEVSKMRPALIVGITRGGLLPALHLSHSLDVPMETVYWSTRDASKQEHNTVVSNAIQNGDTVVFVDDINDTGKTAEQILVKYATCDTVIRDQVKFVTLVEKTTSTMVTDASALRLDDKRWIVFPWEKD